MTPEFPWPVRALALASFVTGTVVYRLVDAWVGIGVMSVGAIATFALANRFAPEPDAWTTFAIKMALVFVIGAVYIAAIVLSLNIEPFWLGFSLSIVVTVGGLFLIRRYAEHLDRQATRTP